MVRGIVSKKLIPLAEAMYSGGIRFLELAHRCGADFVKLFLITNMGVDYVKEVMTPLSHIKLLAVGGVY